MATEITRRAAMAGALLALVCAVARPSSAADAAGDAVWAAARADGAVLLIRHATAPGVGDPAGFRLDDCASQRNLSAAGRAEAAAIGAALRAAGVRATRVWSSEWCRCLETAALMGMAPVARQPLLNSVFARRGMADAQTAQLKAWIASQPADGGSLILVTHQVNISAATGVFARSGEIVVARREADGGLRAVGTIPPP
jgi:phosphohistidine phosphatase SixA